MAKTRQQRRGLSTVVGAVFMILVIVGAINVMLWTMQQQDRVTETIIEKTNSNLNKLNEDIEISNVRVDGGKLNMTVTNAGGAAATLKTIYVVNETAKEQFRYDLDLVVDGRQSQPDIGQALPLTVKDDTRYSVRLITESGNTVMASLTPLSSVALPMQLYLIPPTVTPGENVTVLFAVTNNLTDSSLGTSITPTLSYTPSCTPGPGCQLTQYSTPSPSSVFLTPGNTVLFKWVYKVTAPDETYFTFTASLVGAKPGNQVSEKAYVKLIQESQISTSTTQVIYSSLVQKPEIFLVLPSPFGDNAQKGLWGVVVSNPTEVPMTVSRIVVSTYSTLAAQGSLDSNIFPSSSSCDSPIYPNNANEWSCPHVNMLQWKDVQNPETVAPLSSKSFLVKVVPDDVKDEPAFMVSAAVFTNMGQFTKTGYSSGISDVDNAIANVFMSTTSDPLYAYEDAKILTHKNGITSGSTVKVNVTLVDFDTSNLRYIKSGTKLVINVPTDFTDVTVTSSAGFNSPTTTGYNDGSTQIVADLSQNVGDVNGDEEAVVLSFTAKAPTVTSDKIYIMYALLDGESTPGDFSVGALAEMPLQVIPP